MKTRVFNKNVIIDYIINHITTDYIEKYEPWININSVFTSDNKYKMGFNPEKNVVFDFKTGQSWTIPQFMVTYNHDLFENEKHALDYLFKLTLKHLKNGISLHPQKINNEKIIQPIELKELTKIYPKTKSLLNKKNLNTKIGEQALKLLMKKNLSIEHIKKFKLSYVGDYYCWNCNGTGKVNNEPCDICDHSSGRNPYYGFLIIPTYENGKLVYFQARNTNLESDFRYRNPAIPKSQVVYFYDELEHNKRIFITEGPIDAMTLIDYSATCVMGNFLSDPQTLKILRKNPTEIIFVPDYDPKNDTRELIFKTLEKNIKKIKYHSKHLNQKIKIGVYHWYDKYKHLLINGKKDINDINHTKIEEELIEYLS